MTAAGPLMPRLALCLVIALAAPDPAAGQRLIKVVDEHDQGVKSTIKQNIAGNSWEHLTYTDDSGVTRVALDCTAGRRLQAFPADSEQYWASAPQDCAEDRPLRVRTKSRRSEGVAVTQLKLGDMRTWYMQLQPTLRTTASEFTANGGVQCRISVTATFDRALYEETERGAWRPVRIRTEAPHLPPPAESPVLSQAVAPTSCALASEQRLALEEAARSRLQLATDEAASWQSYRIGESHDIVKSQMIAFVD